MKGPLSYVGGKNRFITKILPMIPAHVTYVEPFAGGAQIFFQKPPSKVEVLNDLDGELVNFYRICQSHHEELLRHMRFLVVSREWYSRLQKTPPENLTDIQRASRYFFLQKSTYGGRVANQSYAAHILQPPNLTRERLVQLIDGSHARLGRVQIESLPYEKVIQKYDRATTFFYIDPPYYGVKGLYRFDFEHDQFEQLARQLKTIKGNFLLSTNDHPEVRKLFAGFQLESFSVSYSLQPHAGRRYKELLIKNY